MLCTLCQAGRFDTWKVLKGFLCKWGIRRSKFWDSPLGKGRNWIQPPYVSVNAAYFKHIRSTTTCIWYRATKCHRTVWFLICPHFPVLFLDRISASVQNVSVWSRRTSVLLSCNIFLFLPLKFGNLLCLTYDLLYLTLYLWGWVSYDLTSPHSPFCAAP